MTRPARGHIDNGPVIWIFLILAATGGWKYLEYVGIAPASLWDRVPGLWKVLLASSGAFIVMGLVGLFLAAWIDGHRERFRVESGNGRRVIQETAIALPIAGASLLLLGLLFIAFGIADDSWPSWIVLVLGFVLALAGVLTACSGKRYVVERGRLAYERRVLTSYSVDWSASWEGDRRPQLMVNSTRSGGAFGQPLVEHHALNANGHEIYGAPYRDQAEKLLVLIERAIAETGT